MGSNVVVPNTVRPMGPQVFGVARPLAAQSHVYIVIKWENVLGRSVGAAAAPATVTWAPRGVACLSARLQQRRRVYVNAYGLCMGGLGSV